MNEVLTGPTDVVRVFDGAVMSADAYTNSRSITVSTAA